MSNTLRVGILGAGGYTGAELVRLLHQHPRLSIVMVGAREKAGKRLPMLDTVRARMGEAIDAGMGEQDWSGIAKLLLEQGGKAAN